MKIPFFKKNKRKRKQEEFTKISCRFIEYERATSLLAIFFFFYTFVKEVNTSPFLSKNFLGGLRFATIFNYSFT